MPPSKDCMYGKWDPKLQQIWQKWNEKGSKAIEGIPHQPFTYIGEDFVSAKNPVQLVREADGPDGKPRAKIVKYEPRNEYNMALARALKETMDDVVPDKNQQRELYESHRTYTDHAEEEKFLYAMWQILNGSDFLDDTPHKYSEWYVNEVRTNMEKELRKNIEPKTEAN